MESNNNHSVEEQAAASVVASLVKAPAEEPPTDQVAAADLDSVRPTKVQKTSHVDLVGDVSVPSNPICPVAKMPSVDANANENADEGATREKIELRPAPYFYYRDFSTTPDDDPLSPLTLPGRVPNFPAKMHAILQRPDLRDVIAWMPHGRSWRVLKPREFEIRVIPTYFEHAKFSSFIRQANGWGFRRITQGRDRNSYYHEMFLRGLPHLSKQMKRPGVAEKTAAEAEHEPDLYKINEMHPTPEKNEVEDESIMLKCTLLGGPKARMPVYSGSLPAIPPPKKNNTGTEQPDAKQPANLFPVAATTAQPTVVVPAPAKNQVVPVMQIPTTFIPQSGYVVPTQQIPSLAWPLAGQNNNITFAIQQPGMPHQATAPATTQAAPQQAATSVTQHQQPGATPNQPTAAAHAAAFQASNAASQFAAGFAAATALSSQHIQQVLNSAFAAAATNQFVAQPNQFAANQAATIPVVYPSAPVSAQISQTQAQPLLQVATNSNVPDESQPQPPRLQQEK